MKFFRKAMSGVCAECGAFFADDNGGGSVYGNGARGGPTWVFCSEACALIRISTHLLEK